TAALDGSPRPDKSDGASQPSIPVDDRQHRRTQAPRHEIVEAAFPCRERLAAAQVEGEQMLLPVRQDADHAQYRNALYSSGTPHTKGKAIEVDVDHVEVGERTRPPRLEVVLQRGHDARHGALGERGRLE